MAAMGREQARQRNSWNVWKELLPAILMSRPAVRLLPAADFTCVGQELTYHKLAITGFYHKMAKAAKLWVNRYAFGRWSPVESYIRPLLEPLARLQICKGYLGSMTHS